MGVEDINPWFARMESIAVVARAVNGPFRHATRKAPAKVCGRYEGSTTHWQECLCYLRWC